MKKTYDSVQNSTTSINTTKIILGTFLSTTLRIFVPVLVLFGAGAAVDFISITKPWGMIIGASIGIIIAAILVFLQLRNIRRGAK